MKRLLLVMIMGLTACSSTTTSTPTLPSPPATIVTVTPPSAATTAPPAQAASPSAILPAPSEPVNLTLTAPDGAQLAASYYAPVSVERGAGQKAPGALLLHMLGRTRADWDAFARVLQKQGIAVLALDLRGHGDSAGPVDWTKAPGDVRAAWDALIARPEVDPKSSAIVGASIGANLALIVGANNAGVATVIALSPGLDYHGVKPAAVLSNFGQRPVLLVASQDDAYAYDSVHQMATQAAALETYYFVNAGHGTAMFSDASLESLLLDWLEKNLGILKG